MESVYAELAWSHWRRCCRRRRCRSACSRWSLGERPLRTGLWFLLGAFSVTMVIGALGAIVIGDVAASPQPSSPKTWVAIVDVVAGAVLVIVVVRLLRRPRDPKRMEAALEKMSAVASSPAIAIVAAGASLANPGGFIPLALKDISQLEPSTAGFMLAWLCFTIVALLPLILAVVALAVAPVRAQRVLAAARGGLERQARVIAAAIVLLLAAALIRNGLAGLGV